MADSIPVILQAVLWPAVGAALLLGLGRLLPNWLQRLIALAAAVASFAILRSLAATGSGGGLHTTWDPIGFFRMGPALDPDRFSLVAAIILAWVTAFAGLGLAGRDCAGVKTSWHGFLLLELAGVLVMLLGANLLTLALGSGLLTLAALGLGTTATRSPDSPTWPPAGLAMPGAAATLLIMLGGLLMDAQLGHASLASPAHSGSALALVGAAGILWLLSLPLSRAVPRAESTAAFVLPFGAGFYLLARVQGLAPVSGGAWLLIAAVALLAGGAGAWLGHGWPAIASHEAGYAIAWAVLLAVPQVPAPVPWPLIGGALALALLALWWAGGPDALAGQRTALPAWLADRVAPTWARLETRLRERAAPLAGHPAARAALSMGGLLPAAGVASLAGLPLTLGAVGRWLLYGALLREGLAPLLLIALVADTLLVAGLWHTLRAGLKANRPRRAAGLAAAAALAIPLVLWGVAPARLAAAVELGRGTVPGVSPWGLGLVVVLPWLVGTWLAYAGDRLGERLDTLRRVADPDWLYRQISTAGRRLVEALYWVGQVGEGEGWWGWALILLALVALFLTLR